jgi:hypothetical protein
MKRHPTWPLAITLLALGACAPTAKITAGWQRPNYAPPSHKKIAVVSWNGQKDTRRSIENFVVSELVKLGISGVAVNDLYEELPAPDQADVVRKKLKSMGVDGAITLHLMSRAYREHTAAPISANPQSAGDFYASYEVYFNPVYGDTTVEVETQLIIECTLFALDGKGPVAIREITVTRSNKLTEELNDFASTLVSSLNEAGVLTTNR